MLTPEQETCLRSLYGARQQFTTTLVGLLTEGHSVSLPQEHIQEILDELEYQEGKLRALTAGLVKRHDIKPSLILIK